MRASYAPFEIGLQNPPSLIHQRFVFVLEENKRTALIDYIDAVDGPTLYIAERETTVNGVDENRLYPKSTHLITSVIFVRFLFGPKFFQHLKWVFIRCLS
jgi:hypothetical protein